MSDTLDELRRLAEELRDAFVQERQAIRTLDHARLETLAAHKRDVAERLHATACALPPEDATLVRHVLEALRVEARATAMLAAAATQSVRTLLGYEPAGAYDRRARRTTNGPNRTLVAY